jgi:hypothetical protein
MSCINKILVAMDVNSFHFIAHHFFLGVTMKAAAKPSISLALVLFLIAEISSSEPADRLNTTTPATVTNATSVVASAVPVAVTNGTTAAVTNATTVIPSLASPTPSVAMVMEGNGTPPKKSELRKDTSEPKKKVEHEKQHEEKSAPMDEIPVKEVTKPSVVKPRKGVEDLKIGPNELCADVSADQMDKCLLGLTPEAKSTTSTTENPPTVSPHSKPNPKPNVTLDAPDQQTPAKREDYIIPVVGIIFVIPLIVILGALVYKKGVDLWERRHYRPMDFLIDGIYNNQ